MACFCLILTSLHSVWVEVARRGQAPMLCLHGFLAVRILYCGTMRQHSEHSQYSTARFLCTVSVRL